LAPCQLGEVQGDTARLEEAVTVYREALMEFSTERAPLVRVEIQNLIGTALHPLSARENARSAKQSTKSVQRLTLII